MNDEKSNGGNEVSSREFLRLFRSLGDETRLRLLRLLGREELTVNELSAITQLAQPRISNHLKILREDRLITERRAGSWRYYRVDPDDLEEPARSVWQSLSAGFATDPEFAGDDKRLQKVLSERKRNGEGNFFDDLANRWDEIREELFTESVGREILRSLIPPNLTIADVGTGTGYILTLFGDRVQKLIAIDNSERMLAQAREKAAALGLRNVEYRQSDAAANPLKKGEADVVTLVQVLHHVEDPGAVVKSLVAGLKPGGLLMINDLLEHSETWLRQELQHRWLGFSRSRIMDLLEGEGLEVVRWDILPGQTKRDDKGGKITVPDSFLVIGRKKG